MSTASAIRAARAFKRAEYGPGDEQTWGPIVDPRDPRADDPEEFTSLQPIGDAEVMVCYEVHAGYVTITGAYIGADRVEPEEFAGHRITAWQLRIQAEVDRDREDAADYARDAWEDAA